MNDIFEKLAKSKFRRRFKLGKKDFAYIEEKGIDVIKQHAADFIKKRIAPAHIENDGKQTPMKNHPVFIAQHATATCCRNCISKWHKIPSGIELDKSQQNYIVEIIMQWIEQQIKLNQKK